MLYHGLGIEKNDQEAAEWFHKAALQGEIKAQRNLVYCYQEGIGVPKDESLASEWRMKALANELNSHSSS